MSERSARVRRLHGITIGVLVVGLVVTAVLSVGAWTVRDNNEDRLLEQRAHEAATIATAAIPSVQMPLTSAASVAQATGGDTTAFLQQVAPLVAARRFSSIAIWRLDGPGAAPLATAGVPSEIAGETPSAIRAVLDRTGRTDGLTVVDLMDAPDRRLGYAVASPAPGPRYVVSAETVLPRDRKAAIASNSGFADLGYALYLGQRENPARLLASSSGGPVPAGVRRASDSVPFGDSSILIVITPRKELGGPLLARLPWLLAAAGVVLTAALTMLVERVGRQRERAEHLAHELEVAADETARLYTEQQRIASMLQHSLLPRELPTMARVEAAARYEAGVEGTEVGGDWYDVIPLTDGSAFFSVGDVVGRGIDAATTMAALRYSIRAHALEGRTPGAVLDRLGVQARAWPDDRFATVVCGVLDPRRRHLSAARAGHFDLVRVEPSPDGPVARFLDVPLGPPVGVADGRPYRDAVVSVPEGAIVLAYTDGLVERRGEHIDVGLERLLESARRHSGSPGALVSGTVDDLAIDGGTDDVAVLALRCIRSAVSAPEPSRTRRDPAPA